MGCWNETCAISNLHIRGDQEVVVVVLVEKEQTRNRNYCYSTQYNQVIPVPFYGKYDEYGGITEPTGIMIDVLLTAMACHCKNFEQGDNQYHDIPVSGDKLTAEFMFEASREDRLFTTGNRRMTPVMIHKQVFDDIMTNFHYENLMAKPSKDHTYPKVYFSDVIGQSLDDAIDMIADKLSDSDASSYFGIDNMFDWNEPNEALSWLSNSNSNLDYTIIKQDVVVLEAVKLYKAGQCTKLAVKAIITEILKVRWLHMFMDRSRKPWIKPTGCGGQNDEGLPYKILCASIQSIICDEESQ